MTNGITGFAAAQNLATRLAMRNIQLFLSAYPQGTALAGAGVLLVQVSMVLVLYRFALSLISRDEDRTVWRRTTLARSVLIVATFGSPATGWFFEMMGRSGTGLLGMDGELVSPAAFKAVVAC